MENYDLHPDRVREALHRQYEEQVQAALRDYRRGTEALAAGAGDPLAGVRQHDRGLEDDVSAILRALTETDAHLDEAGPQWAKDCPEANMYRRVGKAQLEAAEAMEELSLLTGENPRKGQDLNARDKMLDELGDTAFAALLGIQSQVKNARLTWQIFLRAVAKAHSRVPFPPERPS